MMYVWFILGVVLTLLGATWLVDGASGIAKRYNVSEFVIGVCIVGIGTSMPELTVSLLGSIRGSAEIAIGNVTGSNMFNTLLILGVTAMINPILFTKDNRNRDMHLNTVASVLLLLFAYLPIAIKPAESLEISRLEGALFLLMFAGYLFMTFKTGDKSQETAQTDSTPKPLWRLIAMVLLGIAALAAGGRLFVDKGCEIARALKVSETVIAITFMACGTSLPELVTCIVAAAKKRNQLALGNILGSNVSNILLILGCSALVRPLAVDSVNLEGFIFLIATSVLLYLSALLPKRNTLTWYKGVIFVLLYAAYIYLSILA
ncbi:MAG: calcium/sodium antiporter [Bacteroidales bacterium]|nr:calcium/sodium antiporter [Bacteroidales bacterium]